MKRLGRALPVVLTAILALLPSIPDYLSLPLYARIACLAAILLGTVYVSYQQYVRPLFEFESKKEIFFDAICGSLHDRLKGIDPTVRLNIMEISWWIPNRVGRFHIIYARGMMNQLDEHLSLWTSQGACGEALSKRGLYVCDLQAATVPTFKLDASQREKTAKLTLIVSQPIKSAKPKPGGGWVLSDAFIGTINIDSQMDKAYEFYSKGGHLTVLQTALTAVSENCSYLLS